MCLVQVHYKPSSFVPICLMCSYSLQIKMGFKTKKTICVNCTVTRMTHYRRHLDWQLDLLDYYNSARSYVFSVQLSSPVLWRRLATADVPFPIGSRTVPVPQTQQFSANQLPAITFSPWTESLYTIQKGGLFTNWTTVNSSQLNQSESESELLYNWQSVSQYVLVSSPIWDIWTEFFFFWKSLS
jgi:hypothetical protein